LPPIPDVPHYRLIRKMGEGAFSQVFHAMHTPTREPVAIKIVPKSQLNLEQV
ncbi:hypothetical protein BC828DRAFT_330831, partial [Blastocladiella britannica]